MQLSPLNWQDLTPNHSFANHKEAITTFFDFQPKAVEALTQFIHSDFGSMLILKTETLPEFIHEITTFFTVKHHDFLFKNDITRQSLFGYRVFRERTGNVESISGIIEQANESILIIPIQALLADITVWDKLKSALLFGQYYPEMENALPEVLPTISSKFKLLIVGEREDIALLHTYDASLYEFGQYAEIQSYHRVNDQHIKWANYVQHYAAKYAGIHLSENALQQFFQHYVRESEDRTLISISPTLLRKNLIGLRDFYAPVQELDNVQAYFTYQEQQAAVLHQYALQDILNDQLYLETQGEEIGQINGLSVVEFEGIPQAFGEPLRISCNVQYGDGEIQDIERKVELGGNIHSKGILIAQSCLANLLELPTQLPFSASLAFEQSYGEVDGDSSALAIFCVLMSGLSKLPLPQSIAVTGSIDQFGHVLSVGGVNKKIEGFFQVCQKRGLVERQGVIIPKVCLSHLSLNQQVVEAVKQGNFSIWAVENVFEALMILLNRHFFDDEENPQQEDALFSLVHQYIDEHQGEATSGLFSRGIFKWFKRN